MWGIMRAFTEPGIEEINIISCSQIGKTEIILNLIGYFSHQDPSPILVVQPTIEMAEAFSKERLAPMIRDTPILRELYPDPKSRSSGNTLRKKEFPGGYVQLAGANSPAGLAMRPIRVLLLDEWDRYPLSAGAEGDVYSIARKRTGTFWNRLIVGVSSPTERGSSRIEAAEAMTDQRRYHVACPHCRHEQVLTWAHVQWPSKPRHQPEKAAIHCAACHQSWTEAARQQAIRAAMEHGWRPTKTAAKPKTAGFHLSELYSLWRTPADMAHDWLAAQEDTEKLRTFVNTALGESFEIPSDSLSDELLYSRREMYAAPIPNGSHLTISADVQDNRIEAELTAWGENEESWGIDYQVFRDDPGRQKVWDALEQWINKPRRRIDGVIMDVSLVTIDSGGHYTDETYAFCRRAPRRYIPCKGASEGAKPIATFPRTPTQAGVSLTIVGTDTAKELLFSRLQMQAPGAGFHHWPMLECFDREYFAQLTSEKRERHYVRGRPVFRWKPIRHRNEALDIKVLAIVAVRLLQQVARVTLSSIVPRTAQASGDMPSESEIPVAAHAPSRPTSSERRRPRRRGLFD